MNDFSIIIDPSTFSLTRLGGDFTGNLCVKSGEWYFPESCWNDFILTPISMWTIAFKSLIDGSRDAVEFMFMDGPFEIDIHLDNHFLIMNFVRRLRSTKQDESPKRIEFTTKVSLDHFVDEMRRVITAILEYAQSIQMMNKSVSYLKNELEFFEKFRT